jgi:HTH-type transcriptional regulator / antitoxin HigA
MPSRQDAKIWSGSFWASPYLMDQHGMTRADLVPLLGGAARVSEVLNGKTGLSMTMVRRLRERFGISADLLIPRGEPRNAAA